MHVSLSPGRPLFVTLCQWETPCDACGSFPCIPSCDNDLRPAPASPLEAKRSTANSYFTRLDPDVDSDVMPMDIDEYFSPAAVPEAPQQRVGPVALSSLPSPPIPQLDVDK